MYPLDNILKDIDHRNNWFDQISPLIDEVDLNNRRSRIGDYWYAFIPEELKTDHLWKFNKGDIVTNGSEIMVIRALPELDIRENDYCYIRVMEHGNTYFIIRLDENGNDKDIDNPDYYLHDFFTENQIHKVDIETEVKYKNLIKDKQFY